MFTVYALAKTTIPCVYSDGEKWDFEKMSRLRAGDYSDLDEFVKRCAEMARETRQSVRKTTTWQDYVYIGLSKNVQYRYAQHLACLDDSQEEKNAWISSILAQGQKPSLWIVQKGIKDIVEGRSREQYWIRYAMSQGAKLFNKAVTYSPEERVLAHQARAERNACVSSLLAQGVYVKWCGGRYPGRLLKSYEGLSDLCLFTSRDYFFTAKNNKQVSVESATDQEFDAFIRQYIPVENYELDRWYLEDRCNAISFAFAHGIPVGIMKEDEHPLEPVVPTGGRDYPDLEEGE